MRQARKKLSVILPKRETKYAYLLKPMFGSTDVRVMSSEVSSLVQLRAYVKSNKLDGLITSQVGILRLLTGDKKATLENYVGSILRLPMVTPKLGEYDSTSHSESISYTEVLILKDLQSLHTIPYQKFLYSRYIKKLTAPHTWLQANEFSHTVVSTQDQAMLIDKFSSSLFVSVDIETGKQTDYGAPIRCCGYGVTTVAGNQITVENFVLPIDSLEAVKLMRVLNSHPCRKALQNGKYDSAYFYLYAAPLTNYIFDSINMHHCWYSELPKKLDTLAAFYVRDSRYWKGDHLTQNCSKLYEYNARDVYYTALVVAAWLVDSPDWAKVNYRMEFPVVFPSHLSEMTGIALDEKRLSLVKTEKEATVKTLSASLDTMLGVTDFNVNSPPQVKQMMRMLGAKNVTSGDKTALLKLSEAHPLNARILDALTTVRKTRKAISTYLKSDIAYRNPSSLSKGFRPRIMYALNPHGTDTGRLASKAHHFWVGLNIQNIPREDRIKEIAIADDDFLFMEADYAQAESRGTGYIVGEVPLIDATESEFDFHKTNASMFFGVPYDQVSKPLRQLGKPVNHGANYNMGAFVLVQSMGGATAVLKAGKLLGLSSRLTAIQIAEHLLARFDDTYPKIRNHYHKWVKQQVLTVRKLVGATGWTRYCFSDPTKSKLALNAYVAHSPQSLNAMNLNKSYMKVFYNVWMPNSKNFLLLAQIHDSVLAQYRKGHENLVDLVQEEMTFPVEVKDIGGISRTMIVPTDVKGGEHRWSGTAD